MSRRARRWDTALGRSGRAGRRRDEVDPSGGLELLVLEGGFSEGEETFELQLWLRVPIDGGCYFDAVPYDTKMQM
jgi:hypothetical protein